MAKNGINTDEKRKELRERIRRSNLGNAKRVANELEKIYLEETTSC